MLLPKFLMLSFCRMRLIDHRRHRSYHTLSLLHRNAIARLPAKTVLVKTINLSNVLNRLSLDRYTMYSLKLYI